MPKSTKPSTKRSDKSARAAVPTKRKVPKALAVSAEAKQQANEEETEVLRRELPSTQAVSSLLLTLGGLHEGNAKPPEQRLMAVAEAAYQIEAAVNAERKNSAQPAPGDIRAMFALCEYFYRVEGDVANTIDVPFEIINKPIEIQVEGDDEGAKKFWNEEFWYRVGADGMPELDIMDLFETTYFDAEIMGQAFPLEVWNDAEKKLDGIAMVEPQSMYVGRPLIMDDLVVVQDELPAAKLSSQQKDLMYQSFVTDMNVQNLPGFQVPIRADCMKPIFAKKRAYMRYAIPHMVRASRNIMHRQILEEYRRGTIEQFLSQLWVFTLGDLSKPETSAPTTAVTAFNRKLTGAVAQHTGFISTKYKVDSKVMKPETLDNLLGNDTHSELTFMIMRDLGFFLYILSGEMPGTGRGGGPQVEVGLQLAIERWKYLTTRFVKWASYISRKYVKKYVPDNGALAKHLPVFIPGAIGIEQAETIKNKIQPLFMMGTLSITDALKGGGYSYEQQLANKKKEKPNAELFLPQPTFNQTATDSSGNQTTNQGTPNATGRPPAGQARPKVQAALDVDGEMEVYGRGEEFRAAIDSQLGGEVNAFFDWMGNALPAEMYKAFQDGFMQYGGLGNLDYGVITHAPQGVDFQIGRIDAFRNEVNGKADVLLLNRPRAMLYAGAVNVAYLLGVQQAMQSHGATEWQRVLHPELSLAGPCAECQADSNVAHKMDEPFFEYHPGGVCSAQSVKYSFAGRLGAAVRVPDFIRKVVSR